VLDPEGPELLVPLETDPAVVESVCRHLVDAFNRYLRGHPGLPMPDGLLGLVDFVAHVVADQADRMALSPEQRDSYYRTAISLLLRVLQADLERRLGPPRS